MKKNAIWAVFSMFFIAAIRLLPGFSSIWKAAVSMPLLKALTKLGDSLPFVLLEWCTAALGAYLFIRILQRKFLRSLLHAGIAILCAYMLIWYPLYFPAREESSADSSQIIALSEALISDLNRSELDFSAPDASPAKLARFPVWMRACGISGFASFFTGEAIVSPELPACALPFVAVHERMHLAGYARERDANIAAFDACLERGGAYAASARIWALRYAMGLLRGTPEYRSLLDNMNSETFTAFRSCGGSYISREKPPFSPVLRLLGVEEAVQDYENMAIHLAARIPQ